MPAEQRVRLCASLCQHCPADGWDCPIGAAQDEAADWQHALRKLWDEPSLRRVYGTVEAFMEGEVRDAC